MLLYDIEGYTVNHSALILSFGRLFLTDLIVLLSELSCFLVSKFSERREIIWGRAETARSLDFHCAQFFPANGTQP